MMHYYGHVTLEFMIHMPSLFKCDCRVKDHVIYCILSDHITSTIIITSLIALKFLGAIELLWSFCDLSIHPAS